MAEREPTNLMRKAAASLFPDSKEEQEAFLHSLLQPEPRGNAVVWTAGIQPKALPTISRESLPEWLPDSVEVLKPNEKAGSTKPFAEGKIYSLDFSSVLTGSALLAIKRGENRIRRTLDMCAAPGGKSILASVFLQPEILLSNEVEGKRLGMLRHNLRRCRIAHSYTQRLEPSEWANVAPRSFDVCLVDAPCSGQSLLAKGQDNPGCFHPSIIKGNARRQRHILAASSETVADGGFLFYSTCTFSRRENEQVIEKFLSSTSDFEPLSVDHLSEMKSPLTELPCYRVYPHSSPGAGGFVCLMRRTGESSAELLPDLSPELLDYPTGEEA